MKKLSFRLARPCALRRAWTAAVLALSVVVSGVEAAEELPPQLVQQINALLADKAARTPAQQKLSSDLLYAIRMARGEAAAPGIPTQRLSFAADANGRVLVTFKAQVTPGLLAQLQQSGAQNISSFLREDVINALVPLAQLESLAAHPDVISIAPAPKRTTHVGRLTSEGDTTHRAGQARTNFGVMGAGVKIGVISDSVDFLGNSQSSGDLPAITVLPGQTGFGAGEGTAMLEIISDIVPKAELFFATAGFSMQDMARNIRDLRRLGCDIIVDDIGFAVESPFQDDAISQAVNDVTSDGAMYFSSASNSGNVNDGTSSTWEGDFRDSGMTFSGSGAAHTYGTTIFNPVDPLGSGLVVLFWADPLGRSTNDYDLFVVEPTGNNVNSSSTTRQNGNDDPYEQAQAAPGERIVIVRESGDARFLHLEVFPKGPLGFQTQGRIRGHAATTNGFGVAAVDVATAFPNPFVGGGPNPVETFSSDGPRRVFFDPAGNPLNTTLTNATNFLSTGGVVRDQPVIAAADGVKTTVPGFNPFFGTSAAAPHAAAIAALIKSYNPGLTPQQIRFALTNTALDIEAPGPDRDSGAGLLNPIGALGSIPPPLPTLIASNLSGGNFNGTIDPNECNELDLILRNNAINSAVGVVATLTTLTPNVTVVVPTQSYPGMPPGSTATNVAPFRIYTSPLFTCGTAIDFTLIVSSSLGISTNNFTIGSGTIGQFPLVFTSTNVISIPDATVSNMVIIPSGVDVPINVNGLFGTIGKVTVGVHILHPAAGDLTLQLIAPDGSGITLASRRGGGSPNYGMSCAAPTVFDDFAATNITAGFPPFLGTYSPQGPLQFFNGKGGTDANGQWRLRALDRFPGLTGAVQCATLSFFPALCSPGSGDCSADVGVSITDAPDPVLVGSNLVYTLTVTNRSSHLAPGTTLLDTLPPGINVLSFTTTRGSCSASAGSVSCALGTLPGNGGATVRITVRPMVAGVITNRATVTSIAADTNPADNTDTETTTVQNPMPILVPFTTSLIAESGPVSGGLEPGETVTINFGLRNIGTLNTTNLAAQLLSTGGVTNVSEPQFYGALVANGLSVARPFSFTATGTNGGVVTASFQLLEGTNNLGVVSFTFALGGGAGYANSGIVNIPDSGPSDRYPSPLFVSGLVGSIAKVTVTISNFTHSFPEDVDILLASPGGQKVLLLSDAGASYAINNVTLTFDDAAASRVPTFSAIAPGTYQPTDYAPADNFGGSPTGPYATTLAAFNGTNPNGTWGLFVYDDTGGDLGRLANGWSLAITTFDPINPHAELSVAATGAPNPAKLGSNVTYTVTVANTGPEVALGVTLTNLLPSGVAFVSAVTSQGVCSNDSGTVLCELDMIPVNSNAVVTVVGLTIAEGAQVFTARVTGGVADFTPANDVATVTTVVEANADLTVALTSIPKTPNVNSTLLYFVAVTNRGPNSASGITVTNILPAGVAFVSAGASQGSGCVESGGVVICDLGTLSAGASATAVITVTTPAAVTPLTDTAYVVAANPPDANLSNNTASLTVNSLNPSFIIEAAMTFLVSESGPITGGMEAGETVAINFELRNIGQEATTNLVATLLATGGVVAPGGPQDYGAILPGGVAVGRTNTFTVAANPGPLLTATLHLQDGPFDLGTVSFIFPVGVTARFTQSAPITMPGFGKSVPYPSLLDVSGLTGVVGKVTLTLAGLSHSYADDLDVLLVSPTGRVVMALSDAGGGNGVTGVTLTFDDDAPGPAPNSAALLSGLYRPTDYADLADVLEPPAPIGPYPSTLSTFQGIDPNGTWSLYIYDDFFQDDGALAGGWSLDIRTVGLIDPQPALLLRGQFTLSGRFEFMLKGVIGGKYDIQSSPNLQNWSHVTNTALTTSNTVMFVDPAPAGSGPRFYRAVHRP